MRNKIFFIASFLTVAVIFMGIMLPQIGMAENQYAVSSAMRGNQYARYQTLNNFGSCESIQTSTENVTKNDLTTSGEEAVANIKVSGSTKNDESYDIDSETSDETINDAGYSCDDDTSVDVSAEVSDLESNSQHDIDTGVADTHEMATTDALDDNSSMATIGSADIIEQDDTKEIGTIDDHAQINDDVEVEDNKPKAKVEVGVNAGEDNTQDDTSSTGLKAQEGLVAEEDSIGDYANAHATDLADGNYVISSLRKVRNVLDVEDSSKKYKANIYLWGYKRSSSQKWKIETVTVDGYTWRKIININSAKAMSASSNKAQNATNVYQQTYKGSASQLWVISMNEDGTYTLYSALGESLVCGLAKNKASKGTNLQLSKSNGTTAQCFSFTKTKAAKPAKKKTVEEAFYILESSSKVITVPNSSKKNGKYLRVSKSNGSRAQAFMLDYDKKSGYYYIINANSGKVVTMTSGDILPGSRVRQYSTTSRKNRLWAFVEVKDGWKIVSAVRADLALGMNGSKLVMKNTEDADIFKLDTYRVKIEEGAYTLASSVKKSLVLGVKNSSWSKGAHVKVYSSKDSLAQRWYIRTLTNGNVTIQNVNSGAYLVVDGDNVEQGWNKGKTRQWILGITLGKGIELRSAKTGKALDLASDKAKSGVDAVISTAEFTLTQSWTLSETELAPDVGYYRISTVLSQKLRLDVAKSSTENGANIDIATDSSAYNQLWRLKSLGKGWYKLQNCNSLYLLTVEDDSQSDEANVYQNKSANTKAQKWRFEMGAFGLRLVSNTGMALDVAEGASSSGTNVDACRANDSKAQAWRFKKVATPDKIGYQNPSWMVQLSSKTVWGSWRNQNWPFNYATPSQISVDATRSACVEAFISRAYDYLGSDYIWDYACSPSVGVDCAGLVLQCAYACGMDFGSMNPYNHYYGGGWHSAYANALWSRSDLKHVSLNSRKRGDLISWPGHVAIYLGNDQIIEAANASVGVRKTGLWVYGTPRGVIRLFN